VLALGPQAHLALTLLRRRRFFFQLGGQRLEHLELIHAVTRLGARVVRALLVHLAPLRGDAHPALYQKRPIPVHRTQPLRRTLLAQTHLEV
jgi:hypothetical protein